MYGIIFEAKDGDILGRSKGDFAGILGRFSYISGTHCKVLKTISGWSIQDLGSTNGTYYNGSRIPANAPVNLQSNSTVKLADLDLLVTFGASNAPADNQGTVRL
jgi:pSer/pThr/pTyr-binding forkhead associated (FHA) protein